MYLMLALGKLAEGRYEVVAVCPNEPINVMYFVVNVL